MRRAILILLVVGGVGCGPRRPYDHLCKIYEDFAALPSSPELFVNIGGRVEQELSSILEPINVVMMSPDAERYEKLQRYAREKQGDDWHCKAIKARFPPGPAQEAAR